MKWRIGKLEIVAWTTGFGLMAYELAAARVLAPSIGSSTYVWTSVIGVIIAALSAGYYAGGRVADARNRALDVVWLLLLSGIGVMITRVIYLSVLDWTVDLEIDPRVQGIIASMILFAPTSFVLGMISPYLVKLNIRTLKHSGQSVASLSTWNAIGSIMGTFVTGFVLFGLVGSQETFVIVVALLVATSWLLVPRQDIKWRLAGSVLIMVGAFIPVVSTSQIVTIDTPTSHYEVMKGHYNNRPLVGLATGAQGLQSGVYTDGSSELAFWYTQEMARLTLEKKPERILMLGGGAFTLPRYLAEKLPDTQIDAVEIDPELKPIAEQYFYYDNPSNVRLIFEDARTFLNTNTEQYDVVLIDVYGEMSIPFTLMTREYAAVLSRATAPDGAVLANIIGEVSDEGPCRTMTAVMDAAYRTEFSHAWYSTDGPTYGRANHIVRYQNQDDDALGQRPLPALGGRLYTDNFAPAERLLFDCQQSQA